MCHRIVSAMIFVDSDRPIAAAPMDKSTVSCKAREKSDRGGASDEVEREDKWRC